MKVEFLTDSEIEDGHQIFIEESEFKKAKNNPSEFASFAFATHCLFAFYEVDDFISRDEYELILSNLEKNGAVIITIMSKIHPKRIYPKVFVSNNNKLKRIL